MPRLMLRAAIGYLDVVPTAEVENVYTGYGYARLTSQGTASGIAGSHQLTMVDSNGQRIKPRRPHHLARAGCGE